MSVYVGMISKLSYRQIHKANVLGNFASLTSFLRLFPWQKQN